MPWVGFEPTIPASERVKTVHVLDRAATVTWWKYTQYVIKFPNFLNSSFLFFSASILSSNIFLDILFPKTSKHVPHNGRPSSIPIKQERNAIIFKLDTRWRWEVFFMHWIFLPTVKEHPYPLDRRLDGPQNRRGHCREQKNPLPCGESNPYSPIFQPVA
jgi:hypothetical protein